jgi:D-amino peptidase
MRNRWLSLWLGVFVLLTAAVEAANPPKVLIIYDMEGVSGISEPDMTRFDRPEKYSLGRKSLTADVNAAIRGLKQGGAGAIWIQDGHGSGNSQEPDLLLDQTDPRATFDFRTIDFDPYSTGLDGSLDAIVCIGMHPRARTNGFMAHTWNSDVAFRINGVDFTETHIIAASAARWGVPVIMVSGDNVLGEQLKPDFPELEFAVGKTAESLGAAEPFARDEIDRRIESAARTAMEKLLGGKFRPYYLRPPFEFELSWRNWQQAAGARRSPLVRANGDLGVRYTAPSFVEGYETSKHILALASDNLAALVRLLQQSP